MLVSFFLTFFCDNWIFDYELMATGTGFNNLSFFLFAGKDTLANWATRFRITNN